jgi:hypothetical protein
LINRRIDKEGYITVVVIECSRMLYCIIEEDKLEGKDIELYCKDVVLLQQPSHNHDEHYKEFEDLIQSDFGDQSGVHYSRIIDEDERKNIEDIIHFFVEELNISNTLR